MTQLGVMAVPRGVTKTNGVSDVDELLAGEAGAVEGDEVILEQA